MKWLPCATLMAAAALVAANPPGFAIWKTARLDTIDKSLATKLSPQKVATETLERYPNHQLVYLHREGDGEAEFHENQVDIFIVEHGNARLVVGGKMVNARNTAPHEMRGSSIQGGETESLGPGDIVHIPARTPHQVLVANGTKFAYAVVKVDVQ